MFNILAQFPILMAMNVFFGILILVIYYGKSDKSAIFWALGAFSLSVGFFLILLRGFFPAALTFGVANFFTSYAAFLFAYSIQYLAHGKLQQKIWPELFCISYASLFPLLISTGQSEHISNYAGATLGVVNLWVFWQARRAGQKMNNSYMKWMGYLFLSTSIIWFFRAIFSGLLGFQTVTDQEWMNWLSMLMLAILIFSRQVIYLAIRLSMSYQELIALTKESYQIKLVTESQKAEVSKNKAQQTEVQLLTSLNALAKARDNETGNHIIRTQHYVNLLALRLRSEGHYIDQLSDHSIGALVKAAPLHDLGKVGIPDSILLKKGSLTEEEWNVMKTHTLIGESVLGAAHVEHDSDADVIAKAIKLAGGHHEKWDGTGYPRGLAGQAIPLEARIMSVGDMYDALVSDRPYKKAWTHEQAVQEIIAKRGTQFDPVIVDIFIAEQDTFREIADRYKD